MAQVLYPIYFGVRNPWSKEKDKRAHNDLQNNTRKTNDRVTVLPKGTCCGKTVRKL